MRPVSLSAAAAAFALLAACESPLEGFETLSEVPLGTGGATAAIPGPGESANDPGVVGALIRGATGEPDAMRVAPGQVLPFGQMATACGLSDAQLGVPIAAQAGYTVRDTAPTTVAPRTHFITGFADGCARQVTAALVLFGDLATHETMRYATPQGAYDATDTAYEEIKARLCGAASGQPCGARLDALAEEMAFVSLYPTFGSTDSLDLLLHDGEVVAADP